MADVNDTSSLGALIRQAVERHKLSDRKAAELSGGVFGHANFGKIKNGKPIQIHPRNLRALATVLQVPLEDVVRAALATHGLPAGGYRTAREAVQSDPELEQLQRRQMLRILDEYDQLNQFEPPVEQAAIEDNPGGTPPGQSEEPDQ